MIRLPFSARAFLLAPLPMPAICSALLVLGSPGRDPLFGFFLFTGIGAVIGYLGTAALVVTLHFVAQARPVTRFVSAMTGTLLAGLGYLPFLWMSWKSSGPDSGPPEESFLGYFLRNWNDPFVVVFLASGFITALLYDTLARIFTRAQPRRKATA
jgi:hypothetical protein